MKQMLAAITLFLATLPGVLLAHPAQDLVQGVTEKFVAALSSPEASDKAYIEAAVDRDVVPHIDFESMTKLTVGKAWKSASAEQRTTLVNEFQSFLLGTYTTALDQYSGQALEFLPYEAGKRDDRAEVRTLFKDPGASTPIPIDYKLHNRNGPWMIYDIKVEQVSLVLGYRSEFGAQIEKGGIDGLINVLKEKNK
ncbi:MAG: ABC transporter substrate-binding protein [Pseudomonadota bacterium]